uniref:protein FAR1-RELATED SEQUENCE 8-like isoform X2 n=1 Tax=Erigeron canadensis TaxID=72917 RepID=UPI001CB8E8B8|nr:protein FAR1-RELATED SEQUENCE 8-like isoform X2 [Erigeron canadensis]
MEDSSDKSEDLLEDDGGDHEIDREQVLEIVNNDVDTESLFGIEGDDLENDSDLVLDLESNENDSEQVLDFESNDLEDKNQVGEFETNGHDPESVQMLGIETNNNNNCVHGDQGDKDNPPPVTGMEFDTYEDAYKYYYSYAKETGFAIRVKSSWTKRNSKEKRGAVLCCNCEGFKTLKEASSRRKETRTGCLAMIRLRLVYTGKWRLDEAKLDHNHSFDPDRLQSARSRKITEYGSKRKFDPTLDVEVRTIKLYRTPVLDSVCYGSSNETDLDIELSKNIRLNLNKGDAQVMIDYFCRVQLINPNFFYIMDFMDEGCVRNVFWIDSRARASYGYFGDVVALDTTCLTNKYKVPLVVFVGVNHHGQTISLGYGLLADESQETYTWLLRTWLTCMSGRPPQTLITDQRTTLQNAISEIFPRAHHRFCLPLVVDSIIENSGNLESEEFRSILNGIIYNSLKVDEFEMLWGEMIQRFDMIDNEWLRKLFEDREWWAPVYLKDTFFAGMFTFQPGESMVSFFHGHALAVLNHNGIEEIPSQYILSRWRKDFKRLYVPDFGSDNMDITNMVQRYVHLHKRALQVVEEGMTSQEHYMVAWQAFKESLSNVRLVADKPVQN